MEQNFILYSEIEYQKILVKVFKCLYYGHIRLIFNNLQHRKENFQDLIVWLRDSIYFSKKGSHHHNLQRWLRLATFQEINFTVQQIWIFSWSVKRQNIVGLCQQTFYFCSADSFSWSCLLLGYFLLNWCKNSNCFRIAVWQSNSMNWNFRGFMYLYWKCQRYANFPL